MLFINFPTGALLTEQSDDKKFYRILNVDRSSDLIYLFPIIKGDKKNRLPIKYCLSEIEKSSNRVNLDMQHRIISIIVT